MISNALFLAALCAEVVSGLAFEAPKATHYIKHREAFSPAPTAAPWSPRELLKRQSSRSSFASITSAAGSSFFADTYLAAADKTCGYLVGGNSAQALVCQASETCDIWPARATTDFGAVACCSRSNCDVVHDCVDAVDYILSCGTACQTNTNIKKCTNLAAPFCNTALWADQRVVDYYCSSVQVSTILFYDTTYSGQSIGGKFTVNDGWETEPATRTTISRGSTRSSIFIPDESETSIATRWSSTVSGPNSVATDDTPNEVSFDDISTPKKKTSIGPIIGGVVGGLAVIAALVAFFLRKRRQKKYAAAAVVPVHTDSHGQAPPPVYNQSFAPPPPAAGSEMDGASKPPPMASVSEHGYFAPAPTPKPYGGESQYAQGPNSAISSDGGDTRRTSAVSPISPPTQYSFAASQSPLPPGASESYVSPASQSYVTPANQAQYPSYPPPGAHDMPPAAHEMSAPGAPPPAAHEMSAHGMPPAAHEMPGSDARR